jgi:hypothetical protein
MISFSLDSLFLNVIVVDQVAGSLGVAHVDPASSLAIVLHQQLVNVRVRFQDIEEAAAVIHIEQMEVGSIP